MATALSVAGPNHTEPGCLALHRDAEYVRIEQEIDAAEMVKEYAWKLFLTGKWESGGMVALEALANGGRLPYGRRELIADLIGKSPAEVGHRKRFWEAYPTADDLANALARFDSWRSVVRSLSKAKRRPEDEADDGQYALPEVDWQRWETGPLPLMIEADERYRYWRPVQEAMGVIEGGPLFAYTPSPPDIPDRLRAAADAYEAFNARLAECVE